MSRQYGGNYATRKEIESHKQKESKKKAIDGTTKTFDWS
jgi:hypothetical protein